jgi:hypothetical protein
LEFESSLRDGSSPMSYFGAYCPATATLSNATVDHVERIVARMFDGQDIFILTAWPVFELQHPRFEPGTATEVMRERYGVNLTVVGYGWADYRGDAGTVRFDIDAIRKMVDRSREENPWFHYRPTPKRLTKRFVTAYCWALYEAARIRRALMGVSDE